VSRPWRCVLVLRFSLLLLLCPSATFCDVVAVIGMQIIIERSDAGKEYGVILVPEGLIEFVPG
jgi:hypothetical protein